MEAPTGEAVREAQKWLEGCGNVKVLGAWGYQTSHTSFAILEANDMPDIVSLLREPMLMGKTEVVTVVDGIAARKPKGHCTK